MSEMHWVIENAVSGVKIYKWTWLATKCFGQKNLFEAWQEHDIVRDWHKIFGSEKNPTVVKLLAKAKLKSLPYNHTDYLPTYPPTHLP